MAKLSNVKTVDMVNGEVTKVAYEGAEYTKVDDVQKGDLALSLIDTDDITKGAFYLITDVDEDGDYDFVDDAGDDAYFYTHQAEVFRKISDTSPTIEERVTALESDVAALKSVEKANETIEFEGAEYHKVDREAREGDVVILQDTGGDLFKVGKSYKVVEGVQIADDDGDLFDLYRTKIRRTRETVDVYELAESPKYVPQEGDIVVVEKLTPPMNGFEIGDVVTVTATNVRGMCSIAIRKRNKLNGYTDADKIRKAMPAEVEQCEKAVAEASKPKLKAGDFVKWTDGSYSLPNGEIFEVFEDTEGVYVIDNDGDKRHTALDNPAYKYEIVNAETAKWAKIGREVNEFKKGDVVRVIEDVCGKEVGKIFEVKRVNKYTAVCDEGHRYDVAKHIELVAPLESLFNAK